MGVSVLECMFLSVNNFWKGKMVNKKNIADILLIFHLIFFVIVFVVSVCHKSQLKKWIYCWMERLEYRFIRIEYQTDMQSQYKFHFNNVFRTFYGWFCLHDSYKSSMSRISSKQSKHYNIKWFDNVHRQNRSMASRMLLRFTKKESIRWIESNVEKCITYK